jgi:hypothetical protein
MPLSQKPICTHDKLSGGDHLKTPSSLGLNWLYHVQVVEK